MAKKIDPKAKAKRQKIVAAVGGVLLLGLLAFQVPRTMKMLHPSGPSESSATPAASSPSSSTPIAAPSLSGGNATASAASGGDGLVDSDAVPAPQSGQLLAFGRFRTKDPFVQQIGARATGATDGSRPTATAPQKGTTGASGSAGPRSGGGGSSPTTTPSVKVLQTTAVISVGGSPQTVKVGGTFPSSNPVFRLVSLTASSARVGIAGGSLENGAPAVTLKKGKPVTLLNTANGTRYVLRLLSIS
jgi:hypothetical protein